jgi:SPP1 family predicted phage head-tail adaptor
MRGARSFRQPQLGAGDLDEQIVIQTQTRTPDGNNGHTVAWSTFATVFAQVETSATGERDEQGVERTIRQIRCTLYRRTDITEAMRVAWAGETWNIKAVSPGPARDLMMELVAERGLGT